MKIISVVSSARKNGNTERIVKLLENQLEKMAASKNTSLTIEHVFLCQQDIRLCRGCRICFEKGEKLCPMRDDLRDIKDKLTDADAIILASPVYVEDINGIMKNWIDRMAYNCHRPAFYGKYAVLITTSGAGASSHSLQTMKNALTAWGFYIVQMTKFRMGALMADQQIEEKYAGTVARCANRLMESIKKNGARSPSFLSLLSFHIQQKYYRTSKNAGAVDRSYWQKNGWLDKNTDYYMPVHKGIRIRLWVSKAFGIFIAKLFI